MHRSSSATTFRTSDEYFLNLLPPGKLSKPPPDDDLPVYNPISPNGTKEHYNSSRENTIHLIPLVLLLCGFILWFFSYPTDELKDNNITM
ncbi:hypothetical protein Lser_V15G24039 [Lactuca serriola]